MLDINLLLNLEEIKLWLTDIFKTYFSNTENEYSENISIEFPSLSLERCYKITEDIKKIY